jgi:hypothetical protein
MESKGTSFRLTGGKERETVIVLVSIYKYIGDVLGAILFGRSCSAVGEVASRTLAPRDFCGPAIESGSGFGREEISLSRTFSR